MRDPVSVAFEDLDAGGVRVLMAHLDAELLERYPQSSIHGLSPAELSGGDLPVVVARVAGQAVGCGALRPLGDGVGEVKRLFVEPPFRRRGVGRLVLAALEDAARGRGWHTLRLETGTRQPESLALYAAMGWVPIPCFGEYVRDPFSRCFEKRLV